MEALQDKYDPNGICFGCGPKNEKGLQIKTYVEGEEYIVKYFPRKEHQAFEGVINGGIIGAIFDCHGNWSSAHALYKENPDNLFPVTVTASFTVKLKRPTPFGTELVTTAKVSKIEGKKVSIVGEMNAGEIITAEFTGLFIKVNEDHPAHQRWG